jgi:hypothetical protein
MPWKDSPASADPNIIRNNVTWSVTRSGGGTVDENFIMDLNRSTGSYILYRRNALTGAEIPVITSDKIGGQYRINLEQGSGGSYVPNGVAPSDYANLTQTRLAQIANNQRKDWYQQNGPITAANLGIPGFNNTANANPVDPNNPIGTSGQGGGGQTQPGAAAQTGATGTVTNTQASASIAEYAGVAARSEYQNLYYPIDIRTTKQDYILFRQKAYTGTSLQRISGTQTFGNVDGRRRSAPLNERSLGSVVLPVQPSINDVNAVTWGDDRLNPIKSALAGSSFNAMNTGSFTPAGGALVDDAAAAAEIFKSNSSVGNALRMYFAGQAVNAENLLARTSGAVLNPNLELLFSGPTLRPFTFTFQLSPRDKDEAIMVKKIIRYFKQGMAVKRGDRNLFLKAPNVFDINYIFGPTQRDHNSLNRIKTCALQSCGVDYTPNGTYMTFGSEDSGDDGTMVTYSLTLQFTELEPVYSDDYNAIDGQSNDSAGIGY